MHIQARYYAPGQGRFVSRDPFAGYLSQPSTLNAYAYALNNPATLTDPSGENPLIFLAVGTLGGLIGGASYGYGSQVADNLSRGMCFWDALTTNIDAGQVALYAGLGTVMGLGIGVGYAGAQALLGYLGIGKAIYDGLNADGDPTNEVRSTIQLFGNLRHAANYGIQKAVDLKNAITGTGLQVHHLIEQRFARALGLSVSQTRHWLSVVVTPEEHQIFTNAWRAAIGYINSGRPLNTGTANIEDIWNAAQIVYADYPLLLEAVKLSLGIR